MLHKLVFDTTNTQDGANVGAYLRSADGTLLTHTDVGGKKALDVRVAEGINVEVDLSHADDSVKIGDGSDFLAINADGSINALAVVTATDLDIRDLSHAADSVKIGDGTDFLAVNADGSLNVIASDVALANSDMTTGASILAVADTEQDLITSPLAGRKYLWLYNHGNRTMYIGKSGEGIDATTGFPVPPGAMMSMRAGAAVGIEWVSALANHDVRYLEIA